MLGNINLFIVKLIIIIISKTIITLILFKIFFDAILTESYETNDEVNTKKVAEG